MSQKKLQALMKLYGWGMVAHPHTMFQIWGTPTPGILTPVGAKGVAPSELIKMVGEKGHDWTEMVEVASYINAAADGYVYYVGTELQGAVLKPSWREMRELAQFTSRHMQDVPIEERLTLEEVMAWTLMVGGNEWEQDLYT